MMHINLIDNAIIISKVHTETTYIILKRGKIFNISICRSNHKSGNIYTGIISNKIDKIGSVFAKIDNINVFLMKKDIENSINPVTKNSYSSKKGSKILLQVKHEGSEHKAPKATTRIKLVGQFLILLTQGKKHAFSSSISPENRTRIRKLLQNNNVNNMFFIARSSANQVSQEQLIKEIKHLCSKWKTMVSAFGSSSKSMFVGLSENKTLSQISTGVHNNATHIFYDNNDMRNDIHSALKKAEQTSEIKVVYDPKSTFMHRFNIYTAIKHLMSRTVPLPCGGQIAIDRTEALTAIDVNTGKSAKATTNSIVNDIFLVNLEAAKIIVEQLNMRNIGGLIVIDFIDSDNKDHHKAILYTLKSCLDMFSTKYAITEMSELGLIELTRQQKNPSLINTMLETCPFCKGMGSLLNKETATIYMLRILTSITNKYTHITLCIYPELYSYIKKNNIIDTIKKIIKEICKTFTVIEDPALHYNDISIKLDNEKAKNITEIIHPRFSA